MPFQLAKDVMQQTLDQVMVLMHVSNGQYFELNPSGTITLENLLNGGDVQGSVDALCQVFDIDAATAARDVHQLITKLLQRQLIERT